MTPEITTSANRPRCVLVSRPPVAGYPPAIYQAELLAQEGFDVTVADTGSTAEFRAAIHDENVHHRALVPAGASDALWWRVQRMLSFRAAAFRLVRSLRPVLTIAYDPEACAAVRQAPRKFSGLLAWHFHEMWEPGGKSMATNLALGYVRRHVAQTDIVIIPDAERASAFVRETGISSERVFVVMNCPRLRVGQMTPERPSPGRAERLRGPLVVYNGSIGPNHGLETAIRSMPRWPGDARLVLKGNARPDYDTELVRLASEVGVSDRVIRLPFSPGFSDYLEAQVGWTVLEPVSENWTFSAGASNKRFECMAAGIPQVSDDTEGVRALMDEVGCGLCIPPLSVEAAATALTRLLADDALCATMAERGRSAHVKRFNYEAQFEPVLQWLRRASAQGNHGESKGAHPTVPRT